MPLVDAFVFISFAGLVAHAGFSAAHQAKIVRPHEGQRHQTDRLWREYANAVRITAVKQPGRLGLQEVRYGSAEL